MSRHSWDHGQLGAEHSRAKICVKCHVSARRFGHGAGSYWDYTAADGTFLGTPGRVPTCPPEIPRRRPLVKAYDRMPPEQLAAVRVCIGCVPVCHGKELAGTVELCEKHETDEIFRRIGASGGEL